MHLRGVQPSSPLSYVSAQSANAFKQRKPSHKEAQETYIPLGILCLLVADRLLLWRGAKNRVFCCFRYAEFQNRLCWDFDFFTGGGISADARLSLLLDEFPKAVKRELAFLRFAICQINIRRQEIFDLFLCHARLRRHLADDLRLGHLCYQVLL